MDQLVDELVTDSLKARVVVGTYVDRGGRVWLQMDDGSKIRKRRFMSRRVAKRWAKRFNGVAVVDYEFRPVVPVRRIKLDLVIPDGADGRSATC